MKKLRVWIILALVLLLSFSTGCLQSPDPGLPNTTEATGNRAIPSAPETLKIRIMHVNDIHSHLEGIPSSLMIGGTKTYVTLGGMPRLTAKVRTVRAVCPDTLLLCAGDAVQGTLYFPTYNGKAEADFLNFLKFDAMVLGNHEFDKGPGFATEFSERLDFPVLGANVSIKGAPDGLIKPYVIKKIKGEDVAILGLITPQTATISMAGPTVKFSDAEDTAKRYVAILEKLGINKIIVLSHLGYHRDIALAKAVPGIDVIVGGHSHTLLGDFSALGMKATGPYPTKVMNPNNEPVFIVQAWEWAKGAGLLDVEFTRDGRVVNCRGDFTLLAGEEFLQKDATGTKKPVSEDAMEKILDAIAASPEIEVIPQDPEAVTRLDKYSKGVEAFRHEFVVLVTQDMLHVRIPGTAHPGTGDILKQGSMVAPLVAQSMLYKCRSVGQEVDMAIQNAGGVRTDIQAGPLTVADVYNLLPFGNTIYILELSGEEIKQAIEDAVDQALDPVKPNTGGFPYLGDGIYFVVKERAPGQRVFGIKYLNDDTEKWTPIKDGETYKVAVNGFMAHGGDGYSILAKSKGERLDTGFVDAEAFMEYAKYRRLLLPSTFSGVGMK